MHHRIENPEMEYFQNNHGSPNSTKLFPKLLFIITSMN